MPVPGLYKNGMNNWVYHGATELYNPTLDSWSATTAPVPTSVIEHCMEAISPTEIVLFGGRTGSGGSTLLPTTYIYHTNNDSWAALTETLPRLRRQLRCER